MCCSPLVNKYLEGNPASTAGRAASSGNKKEPVIARIGAQVVCFKLKFVQAGDPHHAQMGSNKQA